MVEDSEGRQWVECRQCEGDEGWELLDGEWHICGMCDGEGGYWKTPERPAVGKTDAPGK